MQPLRKTVWMFPKKLKIEPPIIEKTKTPIQKDTGILVFIEALFTIVKMWKQPKCPPTDD